MKITALLYTLMAATAVSAAAVAERDTLGGLEARDTCGSGYNVDQRRTNSGCKAGNGDRHFCGCDRTGVVSKLVLNIPLTLLMRIIMKGRMQGRQVDRG